MAVGQRPSRQQTNSMNKLKHTLIALAAVAGTLTLQPLARADATNAPATPATSDRPGAMRERMQETARELRSLCERIPQDSEGLLAPQQGLPTPFPIDRREQLHCLGIKSPRLPRRPLA